MEGTDVWPVRLGSSLQVYDRRCTMIERRMEVDGSGTVFTCMIIRMGSFNVSTNQRINITCNGSWTSPTHPHPYTISKAYTSTSTLYKHWVAGTQRLSATVSDACQRLSATAYISICISCQFVSHKTKLHQTKTDVSLSKNAILTTGFSGFLSPRGPRCIRSSLAPHWLLIGSTTGCLGFLSPRGPRCIRAKGQPRSVMQLLADLVHSP